MFKNSCLLLLILLVPGLASADAYQVGFTVRDISPTVQELSSETFFFGGFGFWKDRGPAAGNHDALSARAMVLDDGNITVALLVLDTVGVPGPMADELSKRIAAKVAIQAQHILVAATHTHSGPDLLGLWGGVPSDYKARLMDLAVDAVLAAYRSRKPAALSYVVTKGPAHNRRELGFTDDALNLILAKDLQTGKPLGLLFNFAAHPVMVGAKNHLASSDYVHGLRNHLEKAQTGPVIFINGSLGDASPKLTKAALGHKVLADDFAKASFYGELLAELALSIMPSAVPIEGLVKFKQLSFETTVDNWVLSIAHSVGILDAAIEGFFWSKTVSSDISYLVIGDQVEIVTLPGEAVTGTGLAIKQKLNSDMKMIFGLTNGSLGYIIPSEEWDPERHYEESVSLGRHFSDQLLGLIDDLILSAE